MGWRLADKGDLPALKQFILGQEWRAVFFSSHLKQNHPLTGRKPANFLINFSQSSVTDAIMLSPGGLVMPVLAQDGNSCLADPEALPAVVLNEYYPLYSVMGLTKDVIEVEKTLCRKVKTIIDYNLMAIGKHQLHPEHHPAPPGIIIRQTTLRDLKQIYPLQENYEKEEVCLDPDKFSRKACYQNLKRILSSQLSFVAERHGKVIAKAATNARGMCADQIGGVYTIKTERNKGLSYRVMYQLLQRIFREKDLACLFVKTGNSAAIRLYENLGFKIRDKYRITYYSF